MATLVQVPDNVATWVADNAAAMGVPRDAVWQALVTVAEDA